MKSENAVTRSSDITEDIITKIFDSFLENYEREENILRSASDYSFECVDLSTIKFYDVELKRGSSYIPSAKWVSDKKATINPKNLKDNFCFAYAIIASLHHEGISNNPERITKLRPFVSNYSWKDI